MFPNLEGGGDEKVAMVSGFTLVPSLRLLFTIQQQKTRITGWLFGIAKWWWLANERTSRKLLDGVIPEGFE